jgi:hypothetical protein
MVTHREAIEVIVDTMERQPKLSDNISYITHEADPDGRDANVPTPVIEVQDLNVTRDDPSNSTRIDYLVDDNDNRIAELHETKWEMRLQIDVWTASGSSNDPDQIGKDMREVLYTFDSRGPDKRFVDNENDPVEGIYDFALQETVRDDSLSETPSVQRFRQLARVRGCEQLKLYYDDPIIRATEEGVET